MDDWLALIGSSIPLRGAEAATLQRGFWFSRLFLDAVDDLIEGRGLALVPGSGKTRHAFVALDDVATFLAKAPGRPQALNEFFDLGGPETLSWNQVVDLFAKVLARPVRALHAPPALFRLQQLLLAPLSPAASNLMGMNWIVSSVETCYDMTKVAPMFDVNLTTAEQFLRHKLSLPPH